MRESRNLGILLLVAIFFLALRPAWGQEKGIGEVVVNGTVNVNGQRAVSGSTVYSNQEIETREQSGAIVSFREKGGVLSVEPNSLVRVARADGRIVIEVVRGSIALRPQSLPATVNTAKLRVDAERNGAYRVTSSERGAAVEAGSKNAIVKDGYREVTIHAGETYASWEGQSAKKDKKKKRLGIIIPALIAGPLVIGLALTVARGEDAPPVSPVLPK
ncbi:MAG: hypothetical protein HY650_15805 [Acidobacteria bacterium]|nr:hypothetical protein [Acidobacteriota bacterium]